MLKIKYIIPVLIILVLFWRSIGKANEPERAVNNFAHDLAECAACFLLVSNGPGLDEGTSQKYFDAGASLVEISAQLTSKELTLARIELATKTMKRKMENNWSNFSIIINEYGYFCADLVQKPEARLQYWLDKKD